MITLNNIREIILKQDNELEEIIKEYFLQSKEKNEDEYGKHKINLEKEFNLLLEKGQLAEAKDLIGNYKLKYGINETFYSMEGILFVNEGKFEEAYNSFYQGLEKNNLNLDLLFNMAYVNLLMGNFDESREYCNKCLLYSKDEGLNEQVNDILENLNTIVDSKIYTFITIGVKNNDEMFEIIKRENHNVINIIENKNIKTENKYNENGITIYEVNSISDTLDFITRNNDNCIVFIGDIIPIKTIQNIDNQTKVIYYTNKNLYLDKSNYMNNSIDLFLEKEICDISNFIMTSDISIYNFKKIIEKRNNVFFIKNSIDEILSIINNSSDIFKDQFKSFETEGLNSNYDEYTKILFEIAKEQKNIDNCINLSKYIYDNYNTEESYKIYINLLSDKKDYLSLINSLINTKYCEDIYKLEITYLYNLERYDLIDFILQLSMNVYNKIDLSGDIDINYKMANYAFNINNFKVSYNRYISLLENDKYLINSPIVNRNMSYLLYANENTDYKKFYSVYIELLNSFNEG